MPFSEADETLNLSRFERFDAPFGTAYVHSGDLAVAGDLTGGDLLRACGRCPETAPLDELTMFVVDGDLTVGEALLLDVDADSASGLLVTGTLTAEVVDVDATMLFVYRGAEIRRLVNFATTDGTLSIAGRTRCPLVIYDEGDLNIESTGHILCRRHAGPADPIPDADPTEPDYTAWGWPTVTLTRTEVPQVFAAGLFDENGWVDARRALAAARAGEPLFAAGHG